jgi:hypothetical protein
MSRLWNIAIHYIGFAENLYLSAVIALLMILSTAGKIAEQAMAGKVAYDVEHGIAIFSINLLLVSIARIAKTIISHTDSSSLPY